MLEKIYILAFLSDHDIEGLRRAQCVLKGVSYVFIAPTSVNQFANCECSYKVQDSKSPLDFICLSLPSSVMTEVNGLIDYSALTVAQPTVSEH